MFFQPEVINVFDEDKVVTPNSTLLDETDTSRLAAFNPFTETPVEGVHYEFGEDFGQADEADDYQQPRTFRFSIGFRF